MEDHVVFFYILTLILSLPRIVNSPRLSNHHLFLHCSITYVQLFYRVRSYMYNFGCCFAHIIKDCSFTVNSGDKVFIKGQSGIGKSTLVKLLLGLYMPSQGEITVTADSE